VVKAAAYVHPERGAGTVACRVERLETFEYHGRVGQPARTYMAKTDCLNPSHGDK